MAWSDAARAAALEARRAHARLNAPKKTALYVMQSQGRAKGMIHIGSGQYVQRKDYAGALRKQYRADKSYFKSLGMTILRSASVLRTMSAVNRGAAPMQKFTATKPGKFACPA